jgi:hypothetical protein
MPMAASVMIFWDVAIVALEKCARILQEPLVFIFSTEDGCRSFLQNVVKHY